MKKNPRVSSALKAVDLVQVPSPLIIGERLNTQGSKKAKDMVLNDDFDGLIQLARIQVEDGAHCLDVCVATTERSDELEFMTKLVKRLSLEIDAPLVIDSTDPKVIERSLQQIPGRPIINSINLEGDGLRFHQLAPLMKKYGVPAIAMCIGPNGMAKTPQEKLETAKLLFETGKKYGLKPWQFIFDVLTFTLATGEKEFLDSAKNTIEGIKLVKQFFPESFTTLGLSNVSFGLPTKIRKVVNSVFLYHAIKAGLDTVIINAKDIIPYSELDIKQKELAENLIFNKKQDSLADLISYFENLNEDSSSQSRNKKSAIQIDPTWDAKKKCYFRIVNRVKDGIEDDVIECIKENIIEKFDLDVNKIDYKNLLKSKSKEDVHEASILTLNNTLLPAMKEVGDKFGLGEIILPFVLKSAECMKAAVAELEKYLIKQEGISKGKIVLCTVYGDVHDIGKNLVKTILTNNGYTVYDLGKQVPIQTIIEKINEVNADAVGLSALLVSTSKQMHYFVEYTKENKIDIPILCGGAAINSNYINRIAKENNIYEPGMFYCKTAFDGLHVMNKIMSNERQDFIKIWKDKLEKWIDNKILPAEQTGIVQHSSIKPFLSPIPPHIGVQVRLDSKDINLHDIWKLVNKKSLYVLSWGIRGKGAQGLTQEAENLFNEWTEKVIQENLFDPKVVYGYYRCHSKENKLSVELPNKEQVLFEFPRSNQEKRLCLADYFGESDIVAFQAVTVGQKVTDVIEKWNSENRYTDAYYLHGLAVETAEALAEWTNQIIRDELKIGDQRGLRYSWGYPSCPDVSQHHLVWKILRPEMSGMTLTESGQIIPEHSTAAIIVHHPEAVYFTI